MRLEKEREGKKTKVSNVMFICLLGFFLLFILYLFLLMRLLVPLFLFILLRMDEVVGATGIERARGQISVYSDYWGTADQVLEEGPKALIINMVKFKVVLAENLAWL